MPQLLCSVKSRKKINIGETKHCCFKMLQIWAGLPATQDALGVLLSWGEHGSCQLTDHMNTKMCCVHVTSQLTNRKQASRL